MPDTSNMFESDSRDRLASRRTSLSKLGTHGSMHATSSAYIHNTFVCETLVKTRATYSVEHPLGVIGGVSEQELRALEGLNALHAERVYIVSHWIRCAIAERSASGGLQQPAPIIAQAYARLSGGMTSFMDCKKIVDTPFPYPYAQCVFVSLLVYAVSTPIQNGLTVEHAPSACVLTFVAVAAFFSLNGVAKELEEPFMDEENDVPLVDLHVDLNEKIAKLTSGQHERRRWPSRRAAQPTSPKARKARFVVDEPDGTHGLPAADGASEGVHSQARSERARVTVLPPLAGVPAAASLEAAAPTLNAPTVDGERAT